MTTRGGTPIQIENLPENAKREAVACGQLLLQNDNFNQIGDELSGRYDVWSDNQTLVEISRGFVKSFEPLMTVMHLRCTFDYLC